METKTVIWWKEKLVSRGKNTSGAQSVAEPIGGAEAPGFGWFTTSAKQLPEGNTVQRQPWQKPPTYWQM